MTVKKIKLFRSLAVMKIQGKHGKPSILLGLPKKEKSGIIPEKYYTEDFKKSLEVQKSLPLTIIKKLL